MSRLRLATGAAVAGVVLALLTVGMLAVPAFAEDHNAGPELEENQSIPFAPPDFESTERLVLAGDDPTTAEASPSVDPGLATSNEFNHLKSDWESTRFTNKLDNEPTSDGKVDILEGSVADLQADVVELNEAEQTAYREFEEGTIDAEEFLARLAVIEQRALLLNERFEEVRDASRGITSPVVQDNVTSLQASVGWLQLETETMEGPLRNKAWQSIAGELTDPVPISVTATRDGYVLAATDDVLYTRELYHAGNHDRASGGFLSTEEGGERIALLYPWTHTESFEQDPRVRGDIFRDILTHPHGTTTIYFSGATELPYREIHEIDLAAVPTITATTVEEGDVVVSVERTYAGGPAQIVVTTPTGEPIPDATVQIDGQADRLTDESGSVWLATTGTELSAAVRVDGETVVVTTGLPVGGPPDG